MKMREEGGEVGRSGDDLVLKNTHKVKEVTERKNCYKKKQLFEGFLLETYQKL
jgi:hypothetical protein